MDRQNGTKCYYTFSGSRTIVHEERRRSILLYSPDLAFSDCHLFFYLSHLTVQKSHDYDEIKIVRENAVLTTGGKLLFWGKQSLYPGFTNAFDKDGNCV